MYQIIDDWQKTNKHLSMFDEVIYHANAKFGIQTTDHLVRETSPTFDKKCFMHGVAQRQEDNNGIVGVKSPFFIPMMKFVFDFCDDMGINMVHLGRSCINMTMPSTFDPDTKACDFHIDHTYPHYSILFYLNDTDGDTLISNEKYNPLTHVDESLEYVPSPEKCIRVSPKRGRILLFDGLHFHTGSYPTKYPRTMFVATVIATNEIF